ncbi:hypothetical protein JAAARDRAFT_40237 [Jaapia argillacea MUCL 33604]|uniref:DUF6534 domain-containing protein n=1 Tax=Jaapia argillacea MUCL 33604 TaxID=933084 RepID=A0A067PC44_9AGAM|nr:hypothetical protein JAAARDRAFT_40237 [Jaapia argillacea MUCL 33604]
MTEVSQQEINLILGPVVTSVIVNVFLFGICVLQFSNYYTAGFNDTWHIRYLVFWVCTLDTFHTAASCYMLWDYVVTNFNDLQVLSQAPWPFPSTPIVTVLASIPIQHFLAWRIKRFSGSWFIFGMISFLSITQGAFGIASATGALLTPNIHDFARLIPLVDTWLAVALACDLSITVLLFINLSQRRTGFRRTDSVITRLIRSAVETAAFGSFFCIMDLITFTTLQNTNFHLIFALPMGRIYTNTLLTTLNARQSLQNTLAGGIDTTFNITTGRFDRHDAQTTNFKAATGASGVPTQNLQMDSLRPKPAINTKEMDESDDTFEYRHRADLKSPHISLTQEV